MQFVFSVCRQECILQEVLCCCRTLEGRMRRVELALHITTENGPTHLQSLELSTAGCQTAVQRSHWTEGAPSTTIPAVYDTISDGCLKEPSQTMAQYGSPSGAVGEAAAQHSDHETDDQSAGDHPKPNKRSDNRPRVWHAPYKCHRWNGCCLWCMYCSC